MYRNHQKVILLLILRALSFSLSSAGSNPESREWLDINSSKPSVITLQSGLQYKVLRKGEGKFHPAPNSPTRCHYEGKLIDGTVFDSSYERGSPSTFAPTQVIAGWTEAMQMMVEGDKWELYIPSELGYGDRGSPPKIGGGDVLIFVMEMIEITGEKVEAVKCEVDTLKDCSDKEKDYIEKAKKKFDEIKKMEREIERIARIRSDKGVNVSAKQWAVERSNILQQLLIQGNEGKEL